MTIKKIATTLLAVGLLTGACSASPSGVGSPSEPTDGPPSGIPTGMWIAGDSIAYSAGIRLSAVGDFNIAQGSTGYISRGVKASNVPERIALMRDAYGDPDTLLILAGGNDLNNNHETVEDVFEAASNLHNQLESEGIDVRFVTEPIPGNGTSHNVQGWTTGELDALNDLFIDTYPDTLDCGPAGHPTRGGNDVHPTELGYTALAECIYMQIGV